MGTPRSAASATPAGSGDSVWLVNAHAEVAELAVKLSLHTTELVASLVLEARSQKRTTQQFCLMVATSDFVPWSHPK
eukprot:2042184-Amphidinium_carterae.1